MSVQGPIIFQDVTASFTEEHWVRLEDWQKDVYERVMKEIHEAVIALGYTIVNPNIVINIKRGGESFIRVESGAETSRAATAAEFPEILVNIKEEPLEETRIPQGKHSVTVKDNSMSTGPKMTPVSSSSIKQEKLSPGSLGFRPDTEPLSASGFIKQEPEDADSEDTDNEDYENIIPVVIKQEDNLSGDSHSEEMGPDYKTSNGRFDGFKHKADDIGTFSMPKKRRISPQVHGELLEERDARDMYGRKSRKKTQYKDLCDIFCLLEKKMSKLEFATEDLIVKVQAYPELYDKSHKRYKHVKRTTRIWTKIASELLNEDLERASEDIRSKWVEKVKTRWRSVRDNFNKELNLELKESRSGFRSLHRKPYKFTHKLGFLRPVFLLRQTEDIFPCEENEPEARSSSTSHTQEHLELGVDSQASDCESRTSSIGAMPGPNTPAIPTTVRIASPSTSSTRRCSDGQSTSGPRTRFAGRPKSRSKRTDDEDIFTSLQSVVDKMESKQLQDKTPGHKMVASLIPLINKVPEDKHIELHHALLNTIQQFLPSTQPSQPS
ncbi:uncharacterized protein [Hyperolius riggenbachi]|uniref:uncharacterized protein n=1 Tax=Hyperolius riggenbachi TaxID=752182 RepID=UPI0035A32592